MFVQAHKNKDKLCSNDNVMYKIVCKNYDATYVGQIKTIKNQAKKTK